MGSRLVSWVRMRAALGACSHDCLGRHGRGTSQVRWCTLSTNVAHTILGDAGDWRTARFWVALVLAMHVCG